MTSKNAASAGKPADACSCFYIRIIFNATIKTCWTMVSRSYEAPQQNPTEPWLFLQTCMATFGILLNHQEHDSQAKQVSRQYSFTLKTNACVFIDEKHAKLKIITGNYRAFAAMG